MTKSAPDIRLQLRVHLKCACMNHVIDANFVTKPYCLGIPLQCSTVSLGQNGFKMPGLREDDKVDPLEAQLEAQSELLSLQKHYRCMRNEGKAYTEETENTVRKHRATIERLMKESKDLEAMILVARSRQNELTDQTNVRNLIALLDREVQVKDEFELEKKEAAKVEEKVSAMRETINQQRKKMGDSVDLNHKKHVANMKLIRVMENRLDEMTKKFSIALADNLALREHINHIQGQKERFLDLSKRLQLEISEGKKEIDKLSEMATAHFHARDEAQHRMASLRERTERDLAMYTAEIKDVMRVIEHDRKLREFMTTKAEDRVSILEQELIAQTLKKLENQLSGLKQEVNKYEVIFDKIKEATGIEDTDTLVESFIENEDKNFALFNYVNDRNTEIEGLQDEIRFLKEEIEQTEKEGMENDARRREILKELERKMANVTRELATSKKEYKLSRRMLEHLKPRVESAFVSTKCDRAAITELLGGGATVDDNNVMQYLGIIEQKCNELLQTRALQKVKAVVEVDAGETQIDGLQGAGPQPAHDNATISPPSIDEEGDHTWHASDAKPLTVEEVQAMIFQGSVRGGQLKGTGAAKYAAKKKRN